MYPLSAAMPDSVVAGSFTGTGAGAAGAAGAGAGVAKGPGVEVPRALVRRAKAAREAFLAAAVKQVAGRWQIRGR